MNYAITTLVSCKSRPYPPQTWVQDYYYTSTVITHVYHITHCSDSVDGSNKVGVSNGCITSLNGPHRLTGRKDQKRRK